MYTLNENKINNVVTGVTGSFICEILHQDIKTVREFRKELADSDSFKAYDQLFGTFNEKSLNEAPTLEDISTILTKLNNYTNYKSIQCDLESKGMSCCGYTEAGRTITVYNSLAQLTINCSKPIGPQIDTWFAKWL